MNITNDTLLIAVTDVQKMMVRYRSPMFIRSYRAGELLEEPAIRLSKNDTRVCKFLTHKRGVTMFFPLTE